MTRITVERIDEKGNKRWSRTRLSIDLVAGVIEIQQRGALGRKKPPLIFRAGAITSFNIVMVGDPLAHFYAGVLMVALLAIFNVLGWVLDGTGWNLVLDFAVVGLAFLLASWIKVPAVRLEQPGSQPSSPPSSDDLALASSQGRDPKTIAQDPAFRRTLVERLVKAIARQPVQTVQAVRNTRSTLDKDPTKTLEQLAELEDSSGQNWVHVVSTWNGVTGTRSLAAQIADVLAAHRYRGMFPDLADDSRWRTARLRRLIGAGLVMMVSLSAAALVILHLTK